MKIKNMIFKRAEMLRKIAFAISICAFLFSSIMLIVRAIDAHKTKDLNKQLSKIQEEIDTIKTTGSDNDMPGDNYYYVKENIREHEWVSLTNMFLPENFEDVRVKERDNLQYLFKMDDADTNEALKRVNEAIAERKRIEEENKAAEIKQQIQRLKKINGDIKGWIRIDNTQLCNPIVQTVDNSFYLEHDVAKNENSYGTIFIDENNDVSDPKKLQGQNIILYGHHMRDGTMFGALKNFRDSEFFKANDIIKLDFFPKSYRFQIFGVYLVNQDFDYRNTKLGTTDDIKSLLNRMGVKRLQSRAVNLSPKDTILTLSTCEYDFENARLVVMAKLITQ